jgi:ligand-binding SRPBCC domain-containing protein
VGELTQAHELHRRQWLAKPIGEVFRFFSDARNLEAITPPWLRFQILPPIPSEIVAGTKIHYRLGWHGIPLRWTTEITDWSPPHRFVDVQLKGPYRLWRHTHTFQEQDGGTWIEDLVRYALPFGPLGRIAHAIRVRRDVEKIFDYRVERIKALFEQ